MYIVEEKLADVLIRCSNNIDPLRLKGINNINASKFYLFKDINKDPSIFTIKELLESRFSDEKICAVFCNMGIQLLRQFEIDKFIRWINENTTNECIITFNLLYNEGNEASSVIMRNILTDMLNKKNFRELSKHINFITRAYNNLAYWGSLFEKAKYKLKNYVKIDVSIDYKELEEFYLRTYDNNLLPDNMKAKWDEIVIDSLNEWQKEHNDVEGKWSFMPGINQKWYTVVFGR